MSSTALLKQKSIKMIGQFAPIIDDNQLVDEKLHKLGYHRPSSLTPEGCKLRLLSSDWWFKTLQTKDDRFIEQSNIKLGKVKKGKEIYCSDQSVLTVQDRQARSKQVMEKKLAVSSDGDEIEMIDILKSSIANPANRLAELMVRMSGFEEYAQTHGDVGEFYTITAPSSYHRYSKGGVNPKHSHNPKEAQEYLVDIWAKIRAKFARQGITVYGFRVAEPHHDGTPHWHMMLFMDPDYVEKVRSIMHDYATAESPEELHHLECPYCNDEIQPTKQDRARCSVRFDYVSIDFSRGTATGYIAKYIAKNLGFNIGEDSEDKTKSTMEVSTRVKSWASTWGIRQFQQIGGASVTVWRELRKLSDLDEIKDSVMIDAVRAADESNWSLFLEIMGGADASRLEQKIKLMKKNRVDSETGEIKLNKYEEIVEHVIGVSTIANEFITRIKEWQIIDKSQHKPTRSDQPTSAHAQGVGGVFPPLESCK